MITKSLILMDVLFKVNFGEFNLSWIKSYLSNRIQWVKIHGTKSVAIRVTSGVPQGGHLSLLLFSLFVNGLKTVIPYCRFLMFADDLKLFRKINSIADCVNLPKRLNAIVLWFNFIGLHFHINKCKSTSFTFIYLLSIHIQLIAHLLMWSQPKKTWVFYSLRISIVTLILKLYFVKRPKPLDL